MTTEKKPAGKSTETLTPIEKSIYEAFEDAGLTGELDSSLKIQIAVLGRHPDKGSGHYTTAKGYVFGYLAGKMNPSGEYPCEFTKYANLCSKIERILEGAK